MSYDNDLLQSLRRRERQERRAAEKRDREAARNSAANIASAIELNTLSPIISFMQILADNKGLPIFWDIHPTQEALDEAERDARCVGHPSLVMNMFGGPFASCGRNITEAKIFMPDGHTKSVIVGRTIATTVPCLEAKYSGSWVVDMYCPRRPLSFGNSVQNNQQLISPSVMSTGHAIMAQYIVGNMDVCDNNNLRKNLNTRGVAKAVLEWINLSVEGFAENCRMEIQELDSKLPRDSLRHRFYSTLRSLRFGG